MQYFLGIDIGTYESKGVLTDKDGFVLASATHPHKMLIPEPGWAEHRPEEDWWNDFVTITKTRISGRHSKSPVQIKRSVPFAGGTPEK